jgi:phage FluMu protein Com
MPALPILIERIRSEYLALPGLKLTMPQARRLWPASDETLTSAINVLVDEGFLRFLPSGTYISVPRPHHTAAKADLAARTADQSIRCPHCQKLNTIHRDQGGPVAGPGTNIRCVACGRVLTRTAIPA